MLLSLLLFCLPRLQAADLQVETAWVDNPDRTFIAATRGTFLVAPAIEHKTKRKHAGIFFLVRTKLEYKHDTDARRLREGEASSTVLAIKPLKAVLVGASVSAGYLWRWRRDFNVNTSRFGDIDGDHFFVESRLFAEKKLAKAWVLDGGFTGRLEDYASSYSVYVNEQNDNISATANSALAYKREGFELKSAVSYARKWWRERRALSSEGFFVAAGDELRPDRIDTATASLKGIVTFEKFTVALTPSWTRVMDLNSDGRSWSGPGVGSELILPRKAFSTKVRADWTKRVYDTQLSSFQSSGTEGLEEETAKAAATASGPLGPLFVEVAHGIERTTSNQTDTSGRKIGTIQSMTTSLTLKHTF
jgi:hypothetical protein